MDRRAALLTLALAACSASPGTPSTTGATGTTGGSTGSTGGTTGGSGCEGGPAGAFPDGTIALPDAGCGGGTSGGNTYVDVVWTFPNGQTCADVGQAGVRTMVMWFTAGRSQDQRWGPCGGGTERGFTCDLGPNSLRASAIPVGPQVLTIAAEDGNGNTVFAGSTGVNVQPGGSTVHVALESSSAPLRACQ